jgi:hypothetical protein
MQKPDNTFYTRLLSSLKSEIEKIHNEGVTPVSDSIEPFVLLPDVVYSKEYLTQAMGLSKNTFTTWKNRGLVKLNTNTKQDLYFGSDIISMFRSPT